MITIEWRKILKSKYLLAGVILVSFLPAIYAVTFIGSMWDPYGHVDRLPVAVVNLDKPTEFEGQKVAIGENLVKELKKDKALDYHFIKDEKFNSEKYVMQITIPENFSENAVTLLGDKPKEMKLDFQTAAGRSYIAEKMGTTAMSTLRDKVSQSVTQMYVKVLFTALGKTQAGMSAADSGTTELLNGALAFSDGATQLDVGLKQYTDGVAQLTKGINELNAKVGTLQTGINTLNNSVDTSQLDTLNAGNEQFKAGLDKLNQTASALAVKLPPLAPIAQSISQLATSYDTLYQGNLKASNGLVAVKGGIGQVNDGVTQLVDGVTKLNDGANTLNAKSPQLLTGAAALDSGSTTLATGIATLDSSLSKGASDLSQLDSNSKNEALIADPVGTKQDETAEVPNNGTAMAPYMMIVAMWVGSIVSTTLFDVRKKRDEIKNAHQMLFSKVLVLLPISIVQSVGMYAMLTLVWNFKTVHPFATVGVLIVTSMAFVSIIAALKAWLGDFGTLLALIFMFIQLSTAGGTYPIELASPFYQAINPFMPMTYGVLGLRNTISIGGPVWTFMLIELAFAAVFAVIWYLMYVHTLHLGKELRLPQEH
ncbi:MAG: YhgE/Pip domain-containing protein [Lactobacillales bacterium]|jgi:putative membrane protein|nr:YhgE/Pip domain-containing protein [Lactobacillales bacterium]